jgi:hypothetical protein
MAVVTCRIILLVEGKLAYLRVGVLSLPQLPFLLLVSYTKRIAYMFCNRCRLCFTESTVATLFLALGFESGDFLRSCPF